MRHLISLTDLTSEEIFRILEISRELKTNLQAGKRPPLMENKVLGLLFEKPSLRTRVSFESLMGQLGGSSLFLGSDVGWGTREPIQDFMPILTSYLDVLVIRAKNHDDVVKASTYSMCPVINGLTDVSHPCQALADILTVMELTDDLSTTKIAYLGDANNVTYSLAVICSRLGIQLSIGAAKGYQFEDSFLADLNAVAGKEIISQSDDPGAAVADANFVYTDVWTSMGQEAEREARLKAFADYQINEELMKLADPNAIFLHCLPAIRGEEVSEAVIDGSQSRIYAQAENRMHAQKGLMYWLLHDRLCTA